MSFAISLHICKNKTRSTCSWQRAPALCLRSTMGCAPVILKKMLINMKSHALQPKEDTRLEEAFPISERNITYHPSLHSTDCNNSIYQTAASGKCSSPPRAPQEPGGQYRPRPQWVPFLQRLSTTSSQGSQAWVHTAVAFGWSKLCLRPKVVLKFNLWSAWQRWEQWVATLTHHLKHSTRPGDSSEDFQAGPTMFHWVYYSLVQLCKIKFNFPWNRHEVAIN